MVDHHKVSSYLVGPPITPFIGVNKTQLPIYFRPFIVIGPQTTPPICHPLAVSAFYLWFDRYVEAADGDPIFWWITAVVLLLTVSLGWLGLEHSNHGRFLGGKCHGNSSLKQPA